MKDPHGIPLNGHERGKAKCRCGRTIEFSYRRSDDRQGRLEVIKRHCSCDQQEVCYYCNKPISWHHCGNVALVA